MIYNEEVIYRKEEMFDWIFWPIGYVSIRLRMRKVMNPEERKDWEHEYKSASTKEEQNEVGRKFMKRLFPEMY